MDASPPSDGGKHYPADGCDGKVFVLICIQVESSNRMERKPGAANMKFDNQHVPILDFLYKKPNTTLPGFSEAPENQEELTLGAYDDPQRSKIQLYERMEDIQSRNEELESYASMLAHDLKEPLAVMVLTANLINKITDLSRDELREYLQQIKSTAYQMNTTINSLLLFAKVSRAEAPIERVDMDRVVKNVRQRLSHLIDEHQAQLDLPSSWPTAFGYAP